MLLDQSIIITLKRGNLGFYNKLMDTKYKVGDVMEIPIEKLSKMSKELVNICCDVCKAENRIIYKNYNMCLGYGFYTCMKCKHIKKKMTSIERYGDSTFNNVYKRKETMNENYGYYNNNRDKSINTCIQRYGVSNVSKIESVKSSKIETSLKNWGVKNVFQSDIIKEISKLTNNRKYGFDYATQNIDIFRKAEISGYKIKEYNGLYYRGTYELDFLLFCESNNINVSNGPSIEYFIDNCRKIYHSDFLISDRNLIIEIKSDYTYKINLDINLEKKKYSIINGYNFIFVINKNYNELLNILSI